MTLLEFLADTYLPARSISTGAAQQLTVAVRRFNAFAGHQVERSELKPELLTAWLDSLQGQSAATINGKRSAILCLWSAARRAGLLATEPPKMPTRPPRPERAPNSWTVEQLAALVANCRSIEGEFRFSGIQKRDFLTSLILFQYDTGLRLAATLAVRPASIDLNTGVAQSGSQQFQLSTQTVEAIAVHWDASREFVWPWGPNRHGLWNSLRTVLQVTGLPCDRRRMFDCVRRTTVTILTAQNGLPASSEAMLRLVDPVNLTVFRPMNVLPSLDVSFRQKRGNQ